MAVEAFTHTIDHWIKELERYDLNRLCIQPSPGSWSLGQLYRHLIDDTRYYIEQIRICIATNDNAKEEASGTARIMFSNNEFPDEIIQGAPENAFIPQPAHKEELQQGLLDIKKEMNTVAISMATSPFKGKTKHPGLHYFNAAEWLQLADMHFRHHLRQKKRIDHFLDTGR